MKWMGCMFTNIPSLLKLNPTPHSTLLGHQGARLSCLGSRAEPHKPAPSSVIVNTYQDHSPSVCHPPLPPVFTCLFDASASLLLACKYIRLYHFSRFHIHALIYVIFLFLTYFTLHGRGSSTSLWKTQFHSFSWLSNIPLCIWTTSSLSIYLLVDI